MEIAAISRYNELSLMGRMRLLGIRNCRQLSFSPVSDSLRFKSSQRLETFPFFLKTIISDRNRCSRSYFRVLCSVPEQTNKEHSGEKTSSGRRREIEIFEEAIIDIERRRLKNGGNNIDAFPSELALSQNEFQPDTFEVKEEWKREPISWNKNNTEEDQSPKSFATARTEDERRPRTPEPWRKDQRRKPEWLPYTKGHKREVFTPGPNPRLIPLPSGKVPWAKGPSTLPPASGSLPLNPHADVQSVPGGAPAPSWLKPSLRKSQNRSETEESDISLPSVMPWSRNKVATYRNPNAQRGDSRGYHSSPPSGQREGAWEGSELRPEKKAEPAAEKGAVEQGLISEETERGIQAESEYETSTENPGSESESESGRESDVDSPSAGFRTEEDYESPAGLQRSGRKKKKVPKYLVPPVGNAEIAPMELPFEFKFSYTETPDIEPIGFRGAQFSPFGPTTMSRPWTGGAPLKKGKRNQQKLPRVIPEFDSFLSVPPKGMKGVKPVDPPGPLREGEAPRYVATREEILGDPLSEEEVRELLEDNQAERRQLNLGRDGLTHNMLDNIHSHWKRRRVCKVRCKGVPTVDMDKVCRELEDKTGGVIIHRHGGTVQLYRGRHYNHRLRPKIPIMLWKPPAPIYPRLIQDAPAGLTLEEANTFRKAGHKLSAITKLNKNGVYLDLVQTVREAFQWSELVKVDCTGLHTSDCRKIGAKLKDLVPCVLLSFEKEQILMWRGHGAQEASMQAPGQGEQDVELVEDVGSGLLVDKRQVGSGEVDEGGSQINALTEGGEREEAKVCSDEESVMGEGELSEEEQLRRLQEDKFREFEELWEMAKSGGELEVVDKGGDGAQPK